MAQVAILKPDHLGDLVLSVPAIRAIGACYAQVTLYVGPGSVGLAQHLFPGIEVRAVRLRHLARTDDGCVEPQAFARELDRFDYLFCLRDDPAMREIAARLSIGHVIAGGGALTHETAIQKRAVSAVIGPYSRTRHFSGARLFWQPEPRHVGLCIAAGFPTNRWPNSHWLALAQAIGARGAFLSLIGGPHERVDLALLSGLLRHLPHRIVQGGHDFDQFLHAVEQTDVVVASDGGTAHLCSLGRPVCSVFGSSPWRRYAPFGHDNVLITRDEVCSPCVQFSQSEINGCVSRECTALLRPQQVAGVLFSDGIDFSAVSGVRVERGVSHRYTS